MFQKMDDTNSFAMEMPQFNNQDTTSTENTPITFSWKDLTIKVKGKEARNGFLGKVKTFLNLTVNFPLIP